MASANGWSGHSVSTPLIWPYRRQWLPLLSRCGGEQDGGRAHWDGSRRMARGVHRESEQNSLCSSCRRDSGVRRSRTGRRGCGKCHPTSCSCRTSGTVAAGRRTWTWTRALARGRARKLGRVVRRARILGRPRIRQRVRQRHWSLGIRQRQHLYLGENAQSELATAKCACRSHFGAMAMVSTSRTGTRRWRPPAGGDPADHVGKPRPGRLSGTQRPWSAPSSATLHAGRLANLPRVAAVTGWVIMKTFTRGGGSAPSHRAPSPLPHRWLRIR